MHARSHNELCEVSSSFYIIYINKVTVRLFVSNLFPYKIANLDILWVMKVLKKFHLSVTQVNALLGILSVSNMIQCPSSIYDL